METQMFVPDMSASDSKMVFEDKICLAAMDEYENKEVQDDNTGTNINFRAMNVHINVLNMCRICLVEENLIDILLLGEPTSKWMADIYRYFDVQLTFHEEKSTKLCASCYRKIEVWRQDVHNATKNQNVIEFLDSAIHDNHNQVQEGRNRQNQ